MSDASGLTIGYQNSNRVFAIQDGEEHLVVAENPESAIRIHRELLGYESNESYFEDVGEPLVVEARAHEMVSIHNDETGEIDRKPAWVWADGKQREIGSTLY